MSETHQEVTKVWIEPGCIVCDACENECPEVFDVQEDSCLIRADASADSFTKPLTASIYEAAEGCPVDIIKFETVEVDGPAPWAGKEAEAEAATTSSGGAKVAAAAAIPDGPPDPKWAQVLGRAHISGARSSGGPSVTTRPAAKAPAQAVAMALPSDAPSDAKTNMMVASGFTSPKLSMADRIRVKAGTLKAATTVTRRQFNFVVAGAWAGLAFVGATVGGALQSFMVPKVIKEKPSKFRVGKLSDYSAPGVYEKYKPLKVWLVYLPEGRLVALSTICTHLGCIPNWLASDMKFKCPCHGSGYYMSGVNFEGPAPRPLERFKIALDGEWIVVDKSVKFRQELKQWDLPGAYLSV